MISPNHVVGRRCSRRLYFMIKSPLSRPKRANSWLCFMYSGAVSGWAYVVVRNHDGWKKTYFPLFLLAICGCDCYVNYCCSSFFLVKGTTYLRWVMLCPTCPDHDLYDISTVHHDLYDMWVNTTMYIPLSVYTPNSILTTVAVFVLWWWSRFSSDIFCFLVSQRVLLLLWYPWLHLIF